MAFDIIQLQPDQWAVYRDLRLEALRTEPQAFGATYEENARQPEGYWRGRLARAAEGRGSWLWFARQDDRLVGMIGAHAEGDRGIVEVISMYVSPSGRRQGVARALLAAVLETVGQASRFHCVHLAVNREQASAVALYRSFGFEVCGEAVVRMGDGLDHPELLMECRSRS